MNVKKWIELLKEQDPKDEVILYEWDGRMMFQMLENSFNQNTKGAFIVKSSSTLRNRNLVKLVKMCKDD